MRNIFRRRAAVAALAIGTLLASVMPQATAQTFPDRPIRIVVPYGSGGSDRWARMIAEGMAKNIGQPVVVENVPGANGAVGAARVARSRADGYTLLLCGLEVMTLNPVIQENVTYTPEDFRAISLTVRTGMMIVASKDSGVTDMASLHSYVAKNKDKSFFGVLGVGSAMHLALVQFERATNLDFQLVPFQGTSQMLPELLSGRVPFTMLSPSSLKPLAGTLNTVGYASLKRSSLFPEVKTFDETAVKGFSVGLQYALFAPKETPQPVVDALQKAISSAINGAEMKPKLDFEGLEAIGSTPAEAERVLTKEIATMKQLAHEVGIGNSARK